MLIVMDSSFLLFDLTVNILHAKFISEKSGHMHHANFLQ